MIFKNSIRVFQVSVAIYCRAANAFHVTLTLLLHFPLVSFFSTFQRAIVHFVQCRWNCCHEIYRQMRLHEINCLVDAFKDEIETVRIHSSRRWTAIVTSVLVRAMFKCVPVVLYWFVFYQSESVFIIIVVLSFLNVFFKKKVVSFLDVPKHNVI